MNLQKKKKMYFVFCILYFVFCTACCVIAPHAYHIDTICSAESSSFVEMNVIKDLTLLFWSYFFVSHNNISYFVFCIVYFVFCTSFYV